MSFSIKHLLLLPALLGSISVAKAQAPNCAALKTENEALKDKIVAYEARLGIGVGGVRIEDGDPFLKVKFISCKASKSTHRATSVLHPKVARIAVRIHTKPGRLVSNTSR